MDNVEKPPHQGYFVFFLLEEKEELLSLLKGTKFEKRVQEEQMYIDNEYIERLIKN